MVYPATSQRTDHLFRAIPHTTVINAKNKDLRVRKT
jgi:hypothetical protein